MIYKKDLLKRLKIDPTLFEATLSREILKEYLGLIEVVTSLPFSFRDLKEIEGTGGNVSVGDIIAYQIGWGKCLIRWYEAGIKQEVPEMPGEGFSNWHYVTIAYHFYQKYQYDLGEEQERIFHQVITRILEIVEKENKTGNLNKLGVWSWCSLQSGKPWTLCKWIKVNTSSPYKRATLMIKKMVKKTCRSQTS